ncbi:MAG: carboxypeptidase regulatory-like domain-containing protein, partial [Terriglobia bacterium]
MSKFVWTFFALSVVAIFFSAVLYGQTTTAQISGTVRDSSGGIVPGAEITIRSTGTGISRTLQSDVQGRYVAPDLSIGNYEVRVGSAGFQTQVRTGVTLTVGQHAVFNFTLSPGAVLETVTVTGEAPLVETASSSVGTLVSQAQISELPLNGRDYTQLALLQPGVVLFRANSPNAARGMGATFSVSGARINQVGYRLNGLNIKDGGGGTPGSAAGHNLGVDAIQEFQVLTNTFSAEHGNAAGGIINIVQKSGTNEFHGSLFEYLRNNALDARNFFDPEAAPPFRRNQFGGSLGGPIVREKTFFFGNYEVL